MGHIAQPVPSEYPIPESAVTAHKAGTPQEGHPWSGPDPKGGGGGPPPPPLYRPQNGCTEQCVLGVPEILF